MFFEDLEVRDSVFEELRPYQVPRGEPVFAVRREDRVAEEGLPLLMERFSLAYPTSARPPSLPPAAGGECSPKS
jgi:hypothetical protein